MGFSKIPSRPGITVATSKCDGFGRRSQNQTKFFVSRFMMGFLKIPSQNRLQIFLSAKTRHKNPCKFFCRQKPVTKIRANFLSTKTITKSLAFFCRQNPVTKLRADFCKFKITKTRWNLGLHKSPWSWGDTANSNSLVRHWVKTLVYHQDQTRTLWIISQCHISIKLVSLFLGSLSIGHL